MINLIQRLWSKLCEMLGTVWGELKSERLIQAFLVFLTVGGVATLRGCYEVSVVANSLCLLPIALVAGARSTNISRWSALVYLLATIVLTVWSFSFLYQDLGLVLPDHSSVPFTTYDDALYFSVVTWTTLGYGDFQPTEAARGWAAFEASLGYVVTAIFVGLLLRGEHES